MTDKTALALHHYTEFKCIGSSCEESCCCGWRVQIDKQTYLAYKSNRHIELSELFAQAIQRNPKSCGTHDYASISMTAQGSCAFLDTENLCNIQKHLGHTALSTTCANYPRTANRLGAESEYSLGLSCPEAARLILLDPEPMQFIEVDINPVLERPGALLFGLPTDSGLEPEVIATMNDLRAVVVAILQCREMNVEARLLLLGKLLEESEQPMAKGQQGILGSLPAVLGKYAQMLPHANVIQEQVDALRPDPILRLRLFQAVLTDLQPDIQQPRLKRYFEEVCTGLSWQPGESGDDSALVAHHEEIYRTYYAPFFHSNPHILENCLVHHVFRTLFPLRSSGCLNQFRELVCLFLISHVFLLGMAGSRKGASNEMAVEFFYSFARLSSHSQNYLAQVASSLEKRLGVNIAGLVGTLTAPAQEKS
jgi:lysine-N-methylase